MSASVRATTTPWPSSDVYASRARRRPVVVGSLALALAGAYAVAIVASDGAPALLVPLVAALVGLAVLVRPATGVYLLFGEALLFEQYQIAGLSSITAMTHIYENISSYTSIPLRISVSDLLILLTFAGLAVRRATGSCEPLRGGPFGRPVAGLAAAFALGTVIGVVRGGQWDPIWALAELRGPVYLCVLYFLAVNLIRDRRQLTVLIWAFVGLVGVKAVQAILNHDVTANLYALEAVTAHEDVVFFDLAIALLLVLLVLGIRTKLTYALLALQPPILIAELLTQRRVGFVALGTVLVVITVLSVVTHPRRGLLLAVVAALAVGAYLTVFWDESGPIAEPVRALRGVLDPSSVSTRDFFSDHWREIENRNIAYTVRQLPLTGVGVGQQYLFAEEPPRLAGDDYWRYWTHNALMWLWLKAGPLGALALWFFVARVLVVGSAMYARLRDPEARWVAALPVMLLAILVIFSSVDMGLTANRTMIAMGIVLSFAALPAQRESGMRSSEGSGQPCAGPRRGQRASSSIAGPSST